MSKYNELVKKLKEIFQIDRPELDFGIYRILNAKADEINNYLENTLKKNISDALATAGNANKEELEAKLDKIIKTYQELEEDPFEKPKVKDLQNQIAALSQGANEHENAVFTHLLSFFSRYYDSGDFVSKRRYKGDTYAIPYAGEEVMLHWANKDQYYIKSGENFANYSFKLDDGRKVSFKLLAADIAKDNRKDNDADRRFVLIEPHARIKFDDEGNEYDEEYQPVAVVESDSTEELVIQFEYKAVKKGTKQDALVTGALQTVLSHELVQSTWADITKREPTEKNPNRTLLEKHLTTYTQRNTADYFIHKDLGGFLSNELDFYIKNEVMNLDNVQNAEVFADIEKQLRMIQCLRSIASDVIKFLAQLENFQKKLWEKKKFITKVNYLVTIDNISTELLGEVATNNAQWNRWKELGLINANHNEKTVDFLNENFGLTVDTSLFRTEFKEALLNQIENLEKKVTGTLVNSDNYQALSLLGGKYKDKVAAVYIDPPYNTSASEILYKNSYKHSSWLSMIYDRVRKGRGLMQADALQCATIDDVEFKELQMVIEELFDRDNVTGIVPIKINPSGRPTERGFALTHEYGIFSGKSEKASISKVARSSEQLKRFKEEDSTSIFEFRNLRREGSNSDRVDGQRQYYPIYADLGTGKIRVPEMHWIETDREWIIDEKESENETVVWPITEENREKNWRWSEANVKKDYSQFLARIPKGSNRAQVYYKYRPNLEGVTPLTFWSESKFSATEHGTKLIKSLFGNSNFSYPKSIHAVEECLSVMGMQKKEGIILDYFAGSGTTAHAVIKLNRERKINNKFILVEQGQYFDSVTKPRVQKVIFSDKWNQGLATCHEGISQVVKVLKIESYEDTLNNLELKKAQQTSDLFEMMNEEGKSDYLLNYMLETESKGSLLSTDDFKKPFDYKMKIAVDSAGASEEQNIDLVETFNYLIGLHVITIESNLDRGYARIEGTLPSGERALILWRDCDKWPYDKFNLETLKVRFDLNPKEKQFDVIYVNGDHNLPTAFTTEDGEITRTLKLRQIEPEFLEQMFAPDELA